MTDTFELSRTANALAELPPTLLISTTMELRFWLTKCHHAQTLEAYSRTLKRTVWIPLECKQWSCRACANTKIRKLARKVKDAKPTRLLTLTVDPSLWKDPRDAFDGTRKHVPQLARKLRTRFGEIEYLRVTELTGRGWPHYHLLIRSPYLPHKVVRDLWKKATGASIVDLRPVKKTLDTYYYLVKYLSKMHKISWTERHVSYSKKFFVDEPPSRARDLKLENKSVIESHPATILEASFRGATLIELAFNVYALQHPDEAKHEKGVRDAQKSSTAEQAPQNETEANDDSNEEARTIQTHLSNKVKEQWPKQNQYT